MPDTQTIIPDSAVKEILNAAPNCFIMMDGQMEEYVAGKSLAVSFPVKDDYLNPAGTMQGGIITAAFDNVFGPLCLLASGTPMTTTLDIHTVYHKPIFADDTLRVKAEVKTSGRTKVYMTAEAFNMQGVLIASATSTYIHLRK